MGNAIVIGILIVVGFFALRSSAKHLRGEGGCCGAGHVPKQRKTIRNVHCRRQLSIEGMHCENCKNAVEKAINSLDGAAARVNLKENRADVVMEKELADEVLIRAVEEAGYHVTAVLPGN